MADGFRFGESQGLFKDCILCVPEAAPRLKAMAKNSKE